MAEYTTENTVLCGASSYAQRSYLSPAFQKLPESIKHELQILYVSITEEAGGVLTFEFNKAGNLLFKASIEDGDYLFDSAANGMEISRARLSHQELPEELGLYYRIAFLREKI